VQIGTRFAATAESSAHPAFKQALVDAGAGATLLMMKKHVPVRLLRNRFFDQVAALEARGASVDEIRELLGTGRARRGILEGDLEDGELEAGQVSGLVRDLPSCDALVQRLVREYEQAAADLPPTLAAADPHTAG
jgi:enoyl-[acyl-carrier protein] reductase II